MNPYEVLEISNNATEEEIKRAFRRIAKATHPDLNSGDPESTARFRRGAEAYAILSDPIRKREFDLILCDIKTNHVSSSGTVRTNNVVENDEVKFTAQNIEYAIHMLYKEVKPYKAAALKALLKGIAWLIGGILVTFFSYQAAANNGGGTYFVMYGAVIFGGIQAIRGLISYVKIQNVVAEAESDLWSKIA